MMATAAGMLRVEVLGPIRAWLGDTEIRLGPPRQRALFAALVFQRDYVVSRADLIKAVWGDDAPATAEGSVYTYMSGLRKVLEPGRSGRAASSVLPSEGSGYRLFVKPDAVDVVEFERLAALATAALAQDDATRAFGTANDALALWHGEPLTGLPGPYAAARRQQLEAQRMALLETRAVAGLQDGKHADLVAELTTLVAQNPLDERLRGLLMIALYRCGRQSDALDQFRQAQQTLAAELGRRPDTELAEIHRQVLANDPALAAPATEPKALAGPRTISVPVATRPRPRARTFVGRERELAQVQDVVSGLIDGEGHALWLDGEPGIGKTELLSRGLAGLEYAAIQAYWGSGDELAREFPLRVMLECLHVTAESRDPRRAKVAELAWPASSRADVLGGGGSLRTVIDGIVDLVRELCEDGPLALIVDGMQWVDEASMSVWNRLAAMTDELPLLLIGICRSVTSTDALDSMRETVIRHGGTVLALTRLSDADVSKLLQVMVGARPGPELLRLAEGAAGNPLYVEELVDALKRDGGVRVASGVADAQAETDGATPISLASALEHRLGFLSPTALDVLRSAAVLGVDFRIEDLAVVLGCEPGEFLPSLDEASVAGVLVVDGARVAFRHPLIRHALYEGTAPSVRAVLHRQAAERLDNAGASVASVAQQLAAAPSATDQWVVGWMCEHGDQVADWAPDIGVELLRHAAAACKAIDPRREVLIAGIARVLYWLGESPEFEIRSVLAASNDPDLRGEMQWTLACSYYRQGHDGGAVDVLRTAMDDPRTSELWRVRCRALLAARQGLGLAERGAAEATARAAIQDADLIGDAFAKAYALENLWLFRSIDRDHAEALQLVDEALATLDHALQEGEADSKLVHLRLSLLDNRVFSLQSLDLLEEADATLQAAVEMVRKYRLPAGLVGATVVNHYWAGRWGAAVAELTALVHARELDMAFRGLRESGPTLLLLHGVAALIAALCDQDHEVNRHLEAAEELPLLTSADRENCDFLVMAEALAAERKGHREAALIALNPVLDERYSPMMLRHQWMPDVVRIAMQAGEMTMARRALEVCEAEARRERTPARAAAALARCQGLVRHDQDLVLSAASQYREVGRPVELAQALEDAAVLCAEAGDYGQARSIFAEAARRYDQFGAVWAIARARSRLVAAGSDVTSDNTMSGIQQQAG